MPIWRYECRYAIEDLWSSRRDLVRCSPHVYRFHSWCSQTQMGARSYPVSVSQWIEGVDLGTAVEHSGDEAGGLGWELGRIVVSLATIEFPSRDGLTTNLDIEPRERFLAEGVRCHAHGRLFRTERGQALSASARSWFWHLVGDNVGSVEALARSCSLVHADLASDNVVCARVGETWRIVAV